jgi:hypothetical protein
VNWRTLRIAVATQANRRESAEIVERLAEARVKTWRLERLTTKGTRCVQVMVEARKFDRACELVSDLLPARFSK